VIALLALLAVGVFVLFRLFTGGGGGAGLVTIPDLKLVESEAASRTLQDLDLKVMNRLENSDTVPQGVVIDTDPTAGSEVEKGSFVTVIESAGTEQFTVPPVVGETEEVARALIEAQRFQVGQVEYTLTEDVAANTVISQDPSSGTPAAAGSLVNLVVSKGPFSVEIPDVSGKSGDEARLTLTRAGFTNVVTDEEFSPDIAAGFTIRTEPEAGRTVGRDDTITVWVSKGPEPAVVPDLIGRTIGDATTSADDAGLVLVNDGDVEVTAASGLAGLVAEQSPGAGNTVDSGTDVRVKVGVIKSVSVPDFTGMTVSEATSAGSAAGLNVVTGAPVSLPANDPNIGKVAAQDPSVGTTVDDGSTVTIFIGEVARVQVPDVVGKPEAQADNMINAAGLVVGNTTQAPSDSVPSGSVISQNPPSGTEVDDGSAVDLVVSTGPASTTAAP